MCTMMAIKREFGIPMDPLLPRGMQRVIKTEAGLPLIRILEPGATIQTTLAANGFMAMMKASGLLMMALYTQEHGQAQSKLGMAYGHQLKVRQCSFKLMTNLLEHGMLTMVQ